jgi:hypothetical protein
MKLKKTPSNYGQQTLKTEKNKGQLDTEDHLPVFLEEEETVQREVSDFFHFSLQTCQLGFILPGLNWTLI